MLRINLYTARWMAGAGLGCAFALRVLGESAPDGVPAGHEKARYDALRAHSPFSLATETPPPAAPQASFATNWFISGIGRIGDEDFVTIKSRDQTAAFSLHGRNAEKPGDVALVSINWSEELGKSTVILRKGTETARLEFNEAEVRAAPPAAPVPPAAPGKAPMPVPQPPNIAGAAPGRLLPGAGSVNAGVNTNPAPSVRRRTVPIQAPR